MSTQKPATAQTPEKEITAVDVYRQKEKFNIIAPMPLIQGGMARIYKVSVETMMVDPDPANEEVYPVGTRKVGKEWVPKLALAGQTLKRLALLAGVSYATNRLDDNGNPEFVQFYAIGVMKKPDGTELVQQGTYSLDLRDVREEVMRLQYARVDKGVAEGYIKLSWEKGPRKRADHKGQGPWVTDQEILREKAARVTAEMNQKRRHKVAICETGAVHRVLRSFFGKTVFTPQELRKPFAVVRVDFQPDTQDREIKRALVAHGMRSLEMLYGRPTAPLSAKPLPAGRQPDVVERGDEIAEDEENLIPVEAEFVEIHETGEPPAEGEKTPPAGETQPQGTPQTTGEATADPGSEEYKRQSHLADLKAMDKSDQLAHINQLVTRKRCTLAGDPGDLTPEKRMELILKVEAMPDATGEPAKGDQQPAGDLFGRKK